MASLTGCTFDLDKIPVKRVKVIDISNSKRISHGCIVGCPKNNDINSNPIESFKQIESFTNSEIIFGRFLFMRNFIDLFEYYPSISITSNTLFYYIKFTHRKSCISFKTRFKTVFNVCLFVKKIKLEPNDIKEYKKYDNKHIKLENGTRMTEFGDNKNDNNSDYDLTQIINTPHGNLSIKTVLELRFNELDICFIRDVPILISFPSIIKSHSYFGQFGDIININIINTSSSQFKSIYIKYFSSKSVLNAINYCKYNTFENNLRLVGEYASSKYCKWFVIPSTTCTLRECKQKHSWCIPQNQNENLRKYMHKIALKTPKLELNKLYSYFLWFFNLNICDIYAGKIRDLCIYFNDYFIIENDCLISKIFVDNIEPDNDYLDINSNNQIINNDIHKHCNETIKELFVYLQDYHHLTHSKMNLQKRFNQLESAFKVINIDLMQLNDKYEAIKCENISLKKQIKIHENNNNNNDGSVNSDIIKLKFKDWLKDDVMLPQYLNVFEKYEYNDITMVEFLNCNIIKKELKINNLLHISAILKGVKQFKNEMNEFNNLLKTNNALNLYHQQMRQNGIVTVNYLKNDIKNLKDVQNILEIDDKKKAKLILDIIHKL